MGPVMSADGCTGIPCRLVQVGKHVVSRCSKHLTSFLLCSWWGHSHHRCCRSSVCCLRWGQTSLLRNPARCRLEAAHRPPACIISRSCVCWLIRFCLTRGAGGSRRSQPPHGFTSGSRPFDSVSNTYPLQPVFNPVNRGSHEVVRNFSRKRYTPAGAPVPPILLDLLHENV